MQIPEYFIRKAARQFGDAGPGWVKELPSLLARCEEQWELTHCVPADNLSINLVCYAQSAIHGEVVLKIAGPHSERFTEMKALELYNGHRACACLEKDEEIAAMLLERIVPGYDLRTLPSKQAQLEIGTALIAELPIPVEETYGFPRYVDWLTRAIAKTHADYNPSPRMITLMTETEARFNMICPNDAPRTLLHGDLHHENMLQHHTGEWKAIDPQGVIGPPFMETARFIENHVLDQNDTLDWEALDVTVTYMAGQLGEPKSTIANAAFILHVLSTCWGYEMNYTQETIAQQIQSCENLLSYAKGI